MYHGSHPLLRQGLRIIALLALLPASLAIAQPKLPDPKRLFNSSLDGNTRRAIDIPEGGKIDASAFKALIKAAVALNSQSKKR